MPEAGATIDLTRSWIGYAALAIFAISYLLVILEETTQLRKSKPVLVAAGLIWFLIGLAYTAAGAPQVAHDAAAHTIGEYGELFLFLLVAITYVNTLEERRVFEVIRTRLTARGLSYRHLRLTRPPGLSVGDRGAEPSRCDSRNQRVDRKSLHSGASKGERRARVECAHSPVIAPPRSMTIVGLSARTDDVLFGGDTPRRDG